MDDREPQEPVSEPMDERLFFAELRDQHASFVPVVGSGLSVGAGAPGFGALFEHLVTQAASEGVKIPVASDTDPFEAVEAVVAATGEEWVQQGTAEFYADRELRPTPALQALAKVDAGLIITTNYDLAIEFAAEHVGRTAQTMTVDQFDLAMQHDPEVLRVLHLHGVCTSPETIVLTRGSYARMFTSEESKLLLRALGTTHRFIFLGHSLAEQEAHIRRDLTWTTEAASVPRSPHLLITNVTSASEPWAIRFREELAANTRVHVVAFDDPDKEYLATVRAAHAISRPAVVDTADQAPLVDPDQLDAHYLPLPMAEARQISQEGGVGAYHARVWQEGEIFSTALDDRELHMILEAQGGAGKSQELLQIAHRSPQPALVQHVTNLQVDRPWSDPGTRFVAGMTTARATRPGVPRLTLDRLRHDSFTLLLDGLDEVAAATRPELLRLLAEVARAYPQHRIVIGSRPLPELTDQETFVRWTPINDMRWTVRYAESRGVSEAQLQKALPDTGDVTDLITIPIYAAAAVSRVYAGTALPRTALELICDLADRQLGTDTRIQADPASVQVWLDRLALVMQICGVSEVTVGELASTALHTDLVDLEPTRETAVELASRALLRDSAGIIRFPANVMKEARAARALLTAGKQGLEILRQHVLIELDVKDADGQPVRAVHPAWVNVLELLLPAADPGWREVIEPYDPSLVARATGTAASSEQHAWAIMTLWSTYAARRVWLERVSSLGNGSSDGDALVRLVSHKRPAGFEETVRAATVADERTLRGNAVELVPYVFAQDEALQMLTATVRDADEVVRRRAAAAGWTMAALHGEQLRSNALLADYVETLAEQAASDVDKMAAETLVDVAVDLASEERAVDIALSSSGRHRRHAVMSLARRVPRSKLLELLRSAESIDGDLLEQLIEDRRLGGREPWASADIAELAHIVAERHDDSYWHHDAMEVLVSQPVVALVAMLEHPLGEEIGYDVGRRLVIALNDSQIEALFDSLTSRTLAPLGALDVALDSTAWDTETVEVATALLSSSLAGRRRPPTVHSTVHSARSNSQRRSGKADAYSDKPEGDLSDDDVLFVFADEGVARAFDPNRRTTSQSTWLALSAGADREVGLDSNQTAQLFRFLLDWSDTALEKWLASQWSDTARDRVTALLPELEPSQAMRWAELMPGPWTPEVVEIVVRAIAVSGERKGRKATLAIIVGERAGEQKVREELARHEGTVWADIVLLRLGDCAAEARMIAREAAAPGGVRRHPDALDEEWVSSLRCPDSTQALTGLVKSALQAGVGTHELGPLCRALDRCAGLESLAIWDQLSADPDIPASSFLYYERRVALAQQLEQHSPGVALNDAEVADQVRAAVHPATNA